MSDPFRKRIAILLLQLLVKLLTELIQLIEKAEAGLEVIS